MKNDNKWIVIVFLCTMILSIIFSFATNEISLKTNIPVTITIIFIVIFIGIIFDMIGASSLTANESTFHAKSAKKIKGAKMAIRFIKNNVKVSSICNDIIGDICGIISGGLGAVLAISISAYFNISITFVTIIVSAVISSLTITGKAIFKNIAIKNADNILFAVSKMLSLFEKSR